MKAFGTGATGYVGWALAQALVKSGRQVHALCRKVPHHLQLPGLIWHAGDIEDKQSLAMAMQGCSEVYHCAALARMAHRDPGMFYRINVAGTENVLAAAADCQIQGLVFTSTGGVFGSGHQQPRGEDDAENTDDFDNDYDRTKRMAEQRVQAYAAAGHHAVIVNPSRVYGPGLPSPSAGVNKLIAQYLRGPVVFVPGNGESVGNYAYVDDVAQGHLQAMQYGTSGQRYIVGGENASYNQLIEMLQAVTDIKRTTIRVPIGLMHAGLSLYNQFMLLTGKNPVAGSSFARRLALHRRLSCEKAMSQLQYTITPLRQGLLHTVEHLQNVK
jgi:nucleoside-diphosphate-sugar epimerase